MKGIIIPTLCYQNAVQMIAWLIKTPTQLGAVTQSRYIVVNEVDALCEKVRAAGAASDRHP